MRETPSSVHHLLRQLEWRSLKLEVSTWRYVKEKPKVNVNNVAIIIDQYVAIVSILRV